MGLYLFSELLISISQYCLRVARGFVMIFQPASLWFLQTGSCQPVGTAALYLPIQPLWLYPAMEIFQALLAAEESEQ